MAIVIDIEEKVEIVVGSQNYFVKVPSLKKFGELDTQLKKLDPTQIAGAYSDFFETLGLPKQVSDQFTLKNWTQLIEEITGSKKP